MVLLLLFLVTVMLAIQAVRYEQLSLAVMAIGGAYLAPLALTVAGDGPGRDNSDSELIWPVGYLVIVGFGVLYLSTVHNWRWLVGIGLAGSVVGYMRWYLDVDDLIGVGVAQFSLTAIFLLWVSSTVLHHFARRTKPDGFDVAVVVGNAVFFALMSYALMWDEYRGWMGLYALLLGLFYAGVGYSLYRRSEDNAPLAHAMGVMAVVIGTIAVPIQLTGPWVTAVWFAAALAFMAASAARDSSATQTRFAGLGLLALGTAWVVLNDVPEARDLGMHGIAISPHAAVAAIAVDQVPNGRHGQDVSEPNHRVRIASQRRECRAQACACENAPAANHIHPDATFTPTTNLGTIF